ncbi:MAG: hypothetical protein LBP52_06080 [Burkholderiaceae bacterium]|nr:hypothetical protein [Burkholderiaceae bacterium]
MIHPDVPDTRLGIRLEMDTYGWARLHFTFDSVTVTIRLSEVFDPFGTLVAWGREIDEGDLPIQMEIEEEEGPVAVLTALSTDDPARVLLRIHGHNRVLLGIMPRAALASALRAELRRFFTTEFDPWHWDWFGHKSFSTTERVLNHPWLAAAK